MKLLNLILFVAIITFSAVLCQQIISNSIANQNNKNDYAELKNVKYGLFSIAEWTKQITVILTAEIEKLSLSETNEKVLRQHIAVMLNTLIDKVDEKIKKENSDSLGGQFTQSMLNIFINLDEIKKGIPEYSDAIMKEVKKSKTERDIKAMLNNQVAAYSSQIFDTQGTFNLSNILLGLDATDIESGRKKLAEKISLTRNVIYKEVGLLIVLSLILFSLCGFKKQALPSSHYVILLLILMILLLAGVTTPMIDMEAKISQMSFMVAGYPIHFEDQVLYFQSKSILDVFWIMITHSDIEMKFVGILLVIFSIVFPLLKLASSLIYFYDYRRARDNAVIKFFVMQSGKWSMADVMVIAIFMAYTGFNGIITSQLGNLSAIDQDVVILTTNGTALQPGYYLFLTYTLLALLLSTMLNKTRLSIPNSKRAQIEL